MTPQTVRQIAETIDLLVARQRCGEANLLEIAHCAEEIIDILDNAERVYDAFGDITITITAQPPGRDLGCLIPDPKEAS